MDNMDNKKVSKVSKVSKVFVCECCNYKCSSKCNLNKHLATIKHKKIKLSKMDNELSILDNKSISKVSSEKFACLCGKEYKYIQGLYKHKTTCNYQEPVSVEIHKPTDASGDMLAMMMEQLNKKDKQMMELLEKKDEQQAEKDKQIELLTNTIKDMIPKTGNYLYKR
jgi:hypothetical protein